MLTHPSLPTNLLPCRSAASAGLGRGLGRDRHQLDRRSAGTVRQAERREASAAIGTSSTGTALAWRARPGSGPNRPNWMPALGQSYCRYGRSPAVWEMRKGGTKAWRLLGSVASICTGHIREMCPRCAPMALCAPDKPQNRI